MIKLRKFLVRCWELVNDTDFDRIPFLLDNEVSIRPTERTQLTTKETPIYRFHYQQDARNYRVRVEKVSRFTDAERRYFIENEYVINTNNKVAEFFYEW